MSSAQRNQRESLFLRLPAEIRCTIYEYALGGKHYTTSKDLGGKTSNSRSLIAPHPLALLSACQQIYAETAVLPFRLNTFSFQVNLDLSKWADDLLPGQRDAVEALRFKRNYIDFELNIYSNRAEKEFLADKGRYLEMRLFPSVRCVYVWRAADAYVPVSPNATIDAVIRNNAVNPDVEVIFEESSDV